MYQGREGFQLYLLHVLYPCGEAFQPYPLPVLYPGEDGFQLYLLHVLYPGGESLQLYLLHVLNPGEEGGQVEYGVHEPELGQRELEVDARQKGWLVFLNIAIDQCNQSITDTRADSCS